MLRYVLTMLPVAIMNLFSAGCEQQASSVLGSGFQPESFFENHASISDPRERWEAYGLDDYVIEEQRLCFCPPPHGFVTLVVRDNKIVSGNDPSNDRQLSAADLQSFQTVEALFDWIESAGERSPRLLDVEYDAQFGYPTRIIYDQSEYIADEEITYHLKGLRKSL